MKIGSFVPLAPARRLHPLVACVVAGRTAGLRRWPTRDGTVHAAAKNLVCCQNLVRDCPPCHAAAFFNTVCTAPACPCWHRGCPAAPLGGKPLHILMITFRGETDVDKGFRAYLAQAGLQVRYTVRDVQQDVGRIPAILEEARARWRPISSTSGAPL